MGGWQVCYTSTTYTSAIMENENFILIFMVQLILKQIQYLHEHVLLHVHMIIAWRIIFFVQSSVFSDYLKQMFNNMCFWKAAKIKSFLLRTT